MYADFAYYTGTFFGDMIEETEWDKYATKASDYIDHLTWSKAQNNAEMDEVKKACCAIADQLKTIDAVRKAAAAKVTEDGIIASESVGSHSRSFRSGADGAEAIKAAEAELKTIATRYLLQTGLLYRGVNRCVHTAHRDGL